MKTTLLICFTVLLFSIAYAATDYNCVNDCTNRGYAYQLCVERCSYEPPARNSFSNGFLNGLEQGQKIRQQQLENEHLELQIQQKRMELQQPCVDSCMQDSRCSNVSDCPATYQYCREHCSR